MEEPKIIKEGNYSPSGHNASSIVSTQGIAPAVMENHGTVTAVVEPKIIDNTFGYDSEDRVYSEYSPTIRSERSGLKVAEPMCSVHPNSHKFEFNPETSIKPISPALRATDYKAPHCVYEPEATAQGSQQGVVAAEPSEDWQTVVGNKQLNPFRGSVEGTSPCITSACGAGGGMTPMLTDADLETTKTKEFIEQVRGHEEIRYRIRKLTPRECFRLMGVDDADIDKLMNASISNTQLYKCAGNSIVVDVLYHLFRKLYIHKGCEQENFQQTLF